MKRIEAKIRAHQLELALNADVIDLATVKPVPRFNVGDTVYIPCLWGLDEIEKVTPRKIKKIEVTKSDIDGKYHVHYYITGHRLPFSYGRRSTSLMSLSEYSASHDTRRIYQRIHK